MPLFKLVPADDLGDAIEFSGTDAREALITCGQGDLVEADLWQEETYLCTVRRSPAHAGLWMVYQKTADSTSELCGCVRIAQEN